MTIFHLLSIILIISLAYGQLTAINGNLSLELTIENSISAVEDQLTGQVPIFIDIQMGATYIWMLLSNNQLQIYSRTNPSIQIGTFSQYATSKNHSYIFIDVEVDPMESTLVLTSYSNSTLHHLLFSININASLILTQIVEVDNISQAPSKIFKNGNFLFSYQKTSTSNDYITRTDLSTSIGDVITLEISNSSIEVSPNKQNVVIWDRHSKVYVHGCDQKFTLRWVFSQSQIKSTDYTQIVHFSADGELAIIETGGKNPTNIINLTSLALQYSVPNSQGVRNAFFLDSGNRFLIVQSRITTYFYYDLHASPILPIAFEGVLSSLDIKPDPEKGYLYCLDGSRITTFGIGIIDANETLAQPGGLTTMIQMSQMSQFSNMGLINITNSSSHSFQNANSSQNISGNFTDLNASTNETNSTSESNFSSLPQQEVVQQFYIKLNYTQAQDTTIQYLGTVLDYLDSFLGKVFTFLFSTPFASFFLSILNYFTFSSIYVLLPVKAPYIVFHYLSMIFKPCQGNVLEETGMLTKMDPLSTQKVTDVRALYFEISSDLVSENYLDFGIILSNVILIELIILLSGRRLFKFYKLRSLLLRERMYIYWGLIVSNMVHMILPWKYVMSEGSDNFKAKLNTSAFILSYLMLLYLASLSLMEEVKIASKSQFRRNYMKVAIRKWWTTYQNFIYPLFVLLQNPVYFLVVIGISQIIFLHNSFTVPYFRGFAIIKAIYPILMNTCFIIFFLSQDKAILAVTSILCLSSFLLGALHNLVEALVRVLRSTYKLIRNSCEEGEVRQEKKRELTVPKNNRKDEAPLKEPSNPVKVLNLKELMEKMSEQIENSSKIQMANRSPVLKKGYKGKYSDIKPSKKIQFKEEMSQINNYIESHNEDNVKQVSSASKNMRKLKKANKAIKELIQKQINMFMEQYETPKKSKRRVKTTKDKQSENNLKIEGQPGQ